MSLARADEIVLTGCHVPSVQARQLNVRGNLILDRVKATSLDLRGATIGGVLSLDGAILANPGGTTLAGGALTVGQGMICGRKFSSTGRIELYDATLPQGLSFSGATLTNPAGWALDAQGMRVDQFLFLGSSLARPDGFMAVGGLRLVGVRVNGYVCCWDAQITGADRSEGRGFAIAGLGMAVSDQLMLSRGFTADGEVHLTGAHVGADVDLRGASLKGGVDRALTAERLVVGGSVLCGEQFTARDSVSLVGSKIDGSLDFRNGCLGQHASQTSDQEQAPTALDLRDVTASRLVARWAVLPESADLRHASVMVLDDEPSAWPSRLRLRDFSYDRLLDNPVGTARTRLAWISRDVEGYIPQPYEQLISAYRRAGRDEAARKVAIAKQRHRRAVLSPAAKAWNWLLYISVGYGYRSWQAALWLLALELAGTAVFAHAYPAQMIAVTRSPMPFSAPVYALDVLLPIISLGQQNSWQPQGDPLYVYWVLIVLGWVFTSALVAGLTGIIKQD